MLNFKVNSALPINDRFRVTEHPEFLKRYGAKGKIYNDLAELLEQNDISASLLLPLVESVEKLERLAYKQVYILGYIDGLKAN